MIKRITRNPYLLYLPLLCVYFVFIYNNKWPTLYGDELRYVALAHNLLKGFYSPPAPAINLWNGPGCPLFLAPFIAVHVPDLYITMVNGVLQYLAVVFLYKSLLMVANRKIAFGGGLLLALYPNGWSLLPMLYTEPLTVFLISAIIYAFIIYYRQNKAWQMILSGLLLGYLVLTKIIFGYVILAGIAVHGVLWLLNRHGGNYLRPLKVLLIAFAVVTPYLSYTYWLTGKPMYWGDSGGMSLYWMSTPYEHEYGDWKLPYLTNRQYPMLFKSPASSTVLKLNHSKEVYHIMKYHELYRDELFKRAALHNIMQHPFKFLQNYYYNCARMLFNFPYSYAYQDSAILGNILRGSLILWGSLICMVITVTNWKRVIKPLRFMLLITAIYLTLSGALSAYPRQLDIMMPVLICWFGFTAVNIQRPKLKFKETDDLDQIDLSELASLSIEVEER